MKKTILFIALAVLFCFSYSALAEPSKSPVSVAAPVKAGKVTSSTEAANFRYTEKSHDRAKGQKIRKAKKQKIFENYGKVTSHKSGFI
jgi:hypothetical protein